MIRFCTRRLFTNGALPWKRNRIRAYNQTMERKVRRDYVRSTPSWRAKPIHSLTHSSSAALRHKSRCPNAIKNNGTLLHTLSHSCIHTRAQTGAFAMLEQPLWNESMNWSRGTCLLGPASKVELSTLQNTACKTPVFSRNGASCKTSILEVEVRNFSIFFFVTFFLLRVFLVAFCGSSFLWLFLSVALSCCYPFLSAILPTCALQKCGFEAPYLGSLSTKLPLIAMGQAVFLHVHSLRQTHLARGTGM